MGMDNLSDFLQDLLIEILIKLPEKDLYKCKCLSRKMYDFITFTCVPVLLSQTTIACPEGFFFSRLSLPRPRQSESYLPRIGCRSTRKTVDEFFYKLAYSSFKHIFTASGWDVDYQICRQFIGKDVSSLLPFKHHARDLLDVCNGLLLFIKPYTCQLYVCNPATKQCISIPKLCDHRPCVSRFSMLAFDPSVSSHYKIVRLPLFEEENLFLEFDIFCSETGVWVRRAVQVNESNSLCGLSLVKNSAYLDGVLYRLLSFNSRKLVSIDLNNIDSVIVRVIDLPVVHKLAVPGCIGVSRRNIYYAYREPQSFNIWHLNEAADWVLNYELSTRKFEAYIVRKFNVQSDETVWLSPYAMHPTDDIVFIGTGDMIFALYLETSTLRLAYSTDSLTCVPGLFHPIFVYISCPVPLNNFRPVTTQKVLWSCKGEVLVTDGDVCSDNPEQCGILPEMDKFVNGVSPEFWVMPTIRSIGLKHVDVTGVGHLLHPSYKGPKF